MQGRLKGQSHILKIAIMVPRRRLSRAIAATFWPRGRRALRARRLRGPNVKNDPLVTAWTVRHSYTYIILYSIPAWKSDSIS